MRNAMVRACGMWSSTCSTTTPWPVPPCTWGSTEVYTDFAIHADGYSRILVDPPDSISARRLGRLVQRVLEIETYRMAALLGLPAAREAAVRAGQRPSESWPIWHNAIRKAKRDDEPELLDRLTRLAGQVESEYAATHSRFSASKAYFELVGPAHPRFARGALVGPADRPRVHGPAPLARAQHLRVGRAPPERAVAARSRMSNLLRTRVEIEQQQSNQAMLATMNQPPGHAAQAAVHGGGVVGGGHHLLHRRA